METHYNSKNVYAAPSETDLADYLGLGVFASKRIRKNQVVEVAPLIILSELDTMVMDLTTSLPVLAAFLGKGRLSNYPYTHEAEFGSIMVLGLGCSSLYNEARGEVEPNATWETDIESRSITLTALKTINKDEEIFIQYNDEDFSPKGWLETYIQNMTESQADAVSEGDFETAQKLKDAVAALGGDVDVTVEE